MDEDQVAVVVNYYAKPGVAAINVIRGSIRKGDLLKYKGYTTHFTEEVANMEINNQPVDEAGTGDLVGVKVKEKVRKNDKVYRVSDSS